MNIFKSKLINYSFLFLLIFFSGITIFLANKNIFTNFVNDNSNSNKLFQNVKINLDINNYSIKNITFDATPEDNKIYVATKNLIFQVNTINSTTITNNNYNTNTVANLVVNMIPYLAKNTNSYINQIQFDKNHNMFFDYNQSTKQYSTNLFVKNINTTNSGQLKKINLPKNVFVVSYFKVSADGKYIVIRSKNTNKIYLGIINYKNSSNIKVDWLYINCKNENQTEKYYFAFDTIDNLYITSSSNIYFLNTFNISKYLSNIINLNVKNTFPIENDSLKNDPAAGIQIHINQNNNVILSSGTIKNNKKSNSYFYLTNTNKLINSDLTNYNNLPIIDTDYIDVTNETDYPTFEFNNMDFGVNNSIALLNDGIDTANSVGLYYSPTGKPNDKIFDDNDIDNIGTFSMYGQETIKNGNVPTAVCVNHFNSSLYYIAFASCNQIAFGNYNDNTILSNGPKTYNKFNKTISDAVSKGFVIGAIVTISISIIVAITFLIYVTKIVWTVILPPQPVKLVNLVAEQQLVGNNLIPFSSYSPEEKNQIFQNVAKIFADPNSVDVNIKREMENQQWDRFLRERPGTARRIYNGLKENGTLTDEDQQYFDNLLDNQPRPAVTPKLPTKYVIKAEVNEIPDSVNNGTDLPVTSESEILDNLSVADDIVDPLIDDVLTQVITETATEVITDAATTFIEL